MAELDGAIPPKATPLEEFSLMLHERIIRLEDQAAQQAALHSPAPQTGFSIDRRDRGWFISALVWAERWPTADERLEEVCCRVLATLPFNCSLSVQESGYNEELQDKLKFSLEILKVLEPNKFVDVGEVTIEGRILSLDVVLQTTDTRCSPEHVGAAIDAAWQGMLLETGMNAGVLSENAKSQTGSAAWA